MSASHPVSALTLPVWLSLWPSFSAGPGSLRVAGAGDHHDGATLDCAECHVMHPAPGAPPATRGELLEQDVNDLCLSCHDGSPVAADVLGGNRGRFPNDVRQAGFLNRLGHVGSPATGHTLDSVESAPGSAPPWNAEEENGPGRGLTCINCHSPHGSRDSLPAYRNLRSDAGNNPVGRGLVSYNDRSGSNDPTRDVFVRRALRYDESAVDFNEPDTRDSAMGRFCAGCHDEFHGSPGSGSRVGGEPRGRSYVAFVRHPSAGVDIGAVGGSWSSARLFATRANRVKVMSSSGVWDPPPRDATPTCISCHKAHGNGNAFGLILRSGSGVPTEDGDTGGGTLEHLCGQCHGDPSVLGRP